MNSATRRRKRELLIRRWGRICWLCRGRIDMRLDTLDRMAFTIDHVVPREHGGTNDIDNLRPAHRKCNMERGEITQGDASNDLR